MSNTSSIFKLMDIFRANGSYNYESLGAIYYILYCLHKGYRIFFSYDNHSNVSDVSIVSQDGQHLKDIILTDFPISNLKPTFIGWSDKHIEQLLLLISNLNVGEEYSSIIENLSQLSLDDMGRKSWDAELPTGIVELVAKISSALSCETIYNPYSKNGSLAIQLHSSSYIGEELYLLNATIARIRLDACHISPEIITLGNPMTHVFPKRCDSVISIPPFMLKQMGSSIELRGTTHKTHTVEDYLLWRYLENEEYRKGIFVFPAGIGFSLRYSEIRETLTKTGCIDTIISLPAGIFHGTGIYTLLLVLNKDKKHDLVKFIDGTKFFVKDKKKNILDVDALFSQYLTPSSNLVYWSNGEEMAYKDFSFSPSMYADYHNEIPEGYNEFDFDKVFRIPQMSPCTTSEEGYVLYPADFSHDYLQIMEGHKDKGTSPNNSYRKSLEPANLAISFLNDTMKIVHLEADAPVFANSNQIPLVVKEDSPIEMEYAIFSLLHNVQFNSLAKQYNGIGMPLRRARDLAKYFKTIRLIAPAKKVLQKQEVQIHLDSLKNEKAQLLKDELARLGTRETVSDLSHMLNTPFSNIGDLLGVLEDEDMPIQAKDWVDQLRDNFEYLKRLILTVGADFSLNSYALENIKVIPFLEKFVRSWSNIMHRFFKIEIVSNLDSSDITMSADPTLLKIALDAIFKNAERHGFGGNYNENNRIYLILNAVNHLGKPFICISVANNGLPFPDSFTIEDYIKRGKHGGKSGKTGLGGYHVYSIVKKMGGYINLSSNADGDTVIELLIPAPTLRVESLNVYNNVENCI